MSQLLKRTPNDHQNDRWVTSFGWRSGPMLPAENQKLKFVGRNVCAVAVPLLWGYQFVAIKVGVTEFPPLFFLALRFLAIALLPVPFVKRPTRQPIA
jgi:hypothetical protein